MAHDITVLVGSTALSPIGADAELIATCSAFCDLERAYDATGHGHEHNTPEDVAAEQERERIAADEQVLADRMCNLSCTTLAGVQAMATAFAAWDRELLRDIPAKDLGDQIASHMVERLLALPTPCPDADLIAASCRVPGK